ncbi:MAG: VIT domain-containing protein [Thermoguttaceae bacterium]
MLRSITRIVIGLLLFFPPAIVQAQGLLIVTDPNEQVRLPRPIIIYPSPQLPHPRPMPIPRPEPPQQTYKIKDLDVRARLIDQVAQVQVSETFVNSGNRAMEVAFVFPLPYDGAIEQMTLLIDGKEYPAKLLDAQQARRLYEEIVRKNRDPALLEWAGRGMFKTSVFPVPPGSERTVSLRYSQLCRQQNGLTDFLFPLSTAKYTDKPVEKIGIHLSIESTEEIKNLYSPTHAVEIKRPDARHAEISCVAKNEVPSADFRLFFDAGKGLLGTRLLSYWPEREKEGFFLLLAGPKIESETEKLPEKTVVFTIDRSGSMSGKKIEQVKAALDFVLNNLRPGDLFNIVAYNDRIETFRPELQLFDDDTRRAAQGFVSGLYAGGSTNIDGALSAALGQLQDRKRPSYIVFLTDGLPTAGVTNEAKIVANAKQQNKVRARILALGVGYDVNSRLLDKIVRENFGQSEYVRPNENIEDRIAALYKQFAAPVLTDVSWRFVFDGAKPEDGEPVNRVYPSGTIDVFAGRQLVLAGRYKKSGPATLSVQGTVNDKSQTFDFPVVFAEKHNNDNFAFVEKLWAYRRVGEILDQLDLKGKNQELIKELVELATRHGILTPYTSFMADENVDLRDLAANTRQTSQRISALKESSGHSGFAQRAMKGSLQRVAQAPASAFGYGAAPTELEAADALRSLSRPAATITAGRLAFSSDAKSELDAVKSNIRQLGNRTFYLRNGRWIDSLASGEQEKNAKRIKQFSAEYFALAKSHGQRLAQYMVFDKPVILTLDDQAYLIEP